MTITWPTKKGACTSPALKALVAYVKDHAPCTSRQMTEAGAVPKEHKGTYTSLACKRGYIHAVGYEEVFPYAPLYAFGPAKGEPPSRPRRTGDHHRERKRNSAAERAERAASDARFAVGRDLQRVWMGQAL